MNVLTDFRVAQLESDKRRLLNYLEAEQAILSGQEYEIEGLKLTRADLKTVTDMIANLEYKINRETEALKPKISRPRFKTIIPKEYL
ncbi:MAG: hypothetical protein IJT21_10020 [Synergistaceae bacterium]|nr:hypothetical protein [Synergistaceae bacterium]